MNSNPKPIPPHCDVVVIGSGPAGSSTAAMLARDGFDVVVLEKAKHPRPQVGESIIPQFWKYTDLLGVSGKIQQAGFLPRDGRIVVWDGKIRQIQFEKFGYTIRGGLHVERDRYDQLLVEHAATQGAQVWEEVVVRGVDALNTGQPCVLYDDRRGNSSQRGQIACQYVVDASGPSAVLASQLNARRLVRGDEKYVGLWAYYRNANFVASDRKVYGPESVTRVKPVTFICSFEDGWAWHIILRDSTSVGLVLNTDRTRGKTKTVQEQYFRETCASIPYLKELLEPATFIEGSLYARPDYSYYSEAVCGDDFFCIGDAATFCDPIFSQGVVSAHYNAAICVWAIAASLKNKHRKKFYNEVFRNRLLQYYGFSRLLAFGDFGGEIVNPDSVKALITTMPRSELELSLSASKTTNRSDNLLRMVREAGLTTQFGDDALYDKSETLSALQW
ncbi:MAG: tryptophan 7-halogenase [Chloroflexi bacterium]|nr:tryptophan 7-halogenase [Chloroflexota bacterium]